MRISRRSLLLGASLSALVIGCPLLADARVRGTVPLSTFNGGRSQTNLNFLASGEYPFLNQFKEAAQWTLNNQNAPVTPDMVDSLGYPNSASAFATGSIDWSVVIPKQTERPGNWCVTWGGTGSIACGGGGSQLTTKTFTGSIAGNVLTIPGSITGGPFQFGEMVQSNSGSLVLPQTVIMAQLSSTTYRVSKSQAVGSVAMTASGGSTSSSSGPNSGFFSCTIAAGIGALVFRILSMGSPSDYINNVQIFHVDDAELLQAGNVFGQKFKQRLIEANFGVIRFLNWQRGNTSNVTTWSTRKPLNYIFYGGYQLRSDLYAGITSNSGNAYTTAIFPSIHSSDGTPWTSGGPKDKDTVHILFNASASAAPCTLDIGGAGFAINILSAYATAMASGTNGNGGFPEGGTFRSLATCVYDATLNAWIKQGGCSGTGSAGIDNCVPPELLAQLCKEVGAHPYYVSPIQTLDSATDYMPNLAYSAKSYVQSNAPWMIPRFEPPNETWNFGGGFYQTTYAAAKSAIEWSGGNFHDWYGKALATLGQMCTTVFGGGLGTSYHLICGVQTITTPSGSNERMTASKYQAQAAPAQSPMSGPWGTITFTKTAANLVTSHICNAQYNAPSDRYSVEDLKKGFAYSVTNAGNPTAQAVTAAAYVDSLTNAADGQFNLAQLAIYYSAWKTWAAGFSVNKMCGYEGDYSPDLLNPLGGGNPTNTAWFSTVSGATKDATGCVLTLGANCQNSELASISGNPGVAGMTISIPAGSISGMTQLNNPGVRSVTFAGGGSANISGTNTLILNQAVYFYGTLPNELTLDTRIQALSSNQSIPYYVVSPGNPFQISATRGGSAITFNSVGSGVTAQECWFVLSVPDSTHLKLDVDSSAFSTYTSGGFVIYSNSQNYSNNIRTAGKYSPNLQGYTYGSISPASNYKNFVDAGGEFPSNYLVGGPTPSTSIWPVLENIYTTATPPQWAANIAFNH